MAELGYGVEWQVLNSKDFVPQNRERVFIVGHFGGISERNIFPITDYTGQTDELQGHNDTDGGVANTLTTRIPIAESCGIYPIEEC